MCITLQPCWIRCHIFGLWQFMYLLCTIQIFSTCLKQVLLTAYLDSYVYKWKYQNYYYVRNDKKYNSIIVLFAKLNKRMLPVSARKTSKPYDPVPHSPQNRFKWYDEIPSLGDMSVIFAMTACRGISPRTISDQLRAPYLHLRTFAVDSSKCLL